MAQSEPDKDSEEREIPVPAQAESTRRASDDARQQESAKIQFYTSNTTDTLPRILSEVDGHAGATRADMEQNCLQIESARNRKKVLDALFGIQPDANDRSLRKIGLTGNPDDKIKFLQRTLGKKVYKVWKSGKIVRKGAGIHFENEGNQESFVFGEEDEHFLRISAPKPPIVAKDVKQRPASAPARKLVHSISIAGDKSIDKTAIIISAKNIQSIPVSSKTIPTLLKEHHVRPASASQDLQEALKATFDLPCIWVHKFHLSIAEITGISNHAETLHIPHHTARERAFYFAFRCLCRIKLHWLLNSEDADDFKEFCSLRNWKRGHLVILEKVLQHRPRWQGSAVVHMDKLQSRFETLQDDNIARRRGKNKEVFLHSSTPQKDLQYILDGRPVSIALLEEDLKANDLDPEWYDRIHILRRRDRRFLTEELVLICEDQLNPKAKTKFAVEDEEAPRSPFVQHFTDSARRAAHSSLTIESDENDAVNLGHPRNLDEDDLTIQMFIHQPAVHEDSRNDGSSQKEGNSGAPELSQRQEAALLNVINDTEEMLLKRGKTDISVQKLASQMLQRARRRAPDCRDRSYINYVQTIAGITPGKSVPVSQSGGCWGSSMLRLVPAYSSHGGTRTQHPAMRPPSAKIRSFGHLQEVSEVLQKPCIGPNGICSSDGPVISRPPTATPRRYRHRFTQGGGENDCSGVNVRGQIRDVSEATPSPTRYKEMKIKV